MTTGERIKNRRIALGLSVDDAAERLGKNRATVYRYENGYIEDMPTPVLEDLARVLSTTPADLMGWKDSPKPVSIPVYGRVAAGIPLEMIENIIDEEELPESLANTGAFFGLQIHGDSMEPKMTDGDIVVVRKQSDAETGNIVIATVNGTEAVCKRLKKYRDGIELISLNPSYESMFYSNEEIKKKPVQIIGRVVELRAKL